MINNDSIEKYKRDGYALLDQIFDVSEIELIKSQIPALVNIDQDRVILEKTGEIRTIFIEEQTNTVIGKLVRLENIISLCKSILHDDVYPHQIKINVKIGLSGDVWDWHQDFVFWHKEDGMPECKAINVAIFLDEVNEFNGPIFVVPGSHKNGIVNPEENDIELELLHDKYKDFKNQKTYLASLTGSLKYTVKNRELASAIEKGGVYSIKGGLGSVLLFDPNIFHASPTNLSPQNRMILFITYNSVNNHLKTVENPRPNFISNRNFAPLRSIRRTDLLT